MAHGRRRLNAYGRRVLVTRIVQHGLSVTAAAEALQVSRQTAYRWLRRYRAEGLAGLVDRPSMARHRPHALPEPVARRQYGWGPHRLAWLLGLPRSTIYGVLRRHRVPRLADLDRPTQRPVRYERARPGELVHLDVKKLARIPQGGGHRLRDRATAPRGRGRGYDFVHVAVDDCSRLACVQTYANERGPTTAHFLTQAHAFRTTRVQLGIRHLVTRPYRPQTNGKAKRFIKTLIHEWVYTRLFRANAARLRTLPAWLTTYNHHHLTPRSMASPPYGSLSTRLVGITTSGSLRKR